MRKIKETNRMVILIVSYKKKCRLPHKGEPVSAPNRRSSCQTNSLSHFMPNTCCIIKSNIITLLLFIDLNLSIYNAQKKLDIRLKGGQICIQNSLHHRMGLLAQGIVHPFSLLATDYQSRFHQNPHMVG